MNLLSTRKNTIIACSSGEGTVAAISVIRISGFENFNWIKELFSLDFNQDSKKIEYKKAYVCYLKFRNQVIDHVVAIFFSAPKSFTGENMAELFVHGNPLNVERILKILQEILDAEIALPGEFSFRAFKNKKINLLQVESLDQFLHSSSFAQLDVALEGIQGHLSEKFRALREQFIRCIAFLDLLLDFSEDVGEEEANLLFLKEFRELYLKVKNLYEHHQGPLAEESIPLVGIFGRSNAGKSSLFNEILGHKRSLVSPIAGTTRDWVSSQVIYKGTTFNLFDTAGIREIHKAEKLEQEGIIIGQNLFKRTFFRIWMDNPLEIENYEENSEEKEEEFLKGLQKVDLLIFSHQDMWQNVFEYKDLLSKRLEFFQRVLSKETRVFVSGSIEPLTKTQTGSIGPIFKIGPIGALGSIEPKDLFGSIEPSEKENKNNGLSSFECLFDFVHRKYKKEIKNTITFSLRHKELIKKMKEALEEISKEYIENGQYRDYVVISDHLKITALYSDELLGEIISDDSLNYIFKNFCIGK